MLSTYPTEIVNSAFTQQKYGLHKSQVNLIEKNEIDATQWQPNSQPLRWRIWLWEYGGRDFTYERPWIWFQYII